MDTRQGDPCRNDDDEVRRSPGERRDCGSPAPGQQGAHPHGGHRGEQGDRDHHEVQLRAPVERLGVSHGGRIGRILQERDEVDGQERRQLAAHERETFIRRVSPTIVSRRSESSNERSDLMPDSSSVPYGRSTQHAPAVKEVHILWITAGLGCDGRQHTN